MEAGFAPGQSTVYHRVPDHLTGEVLYPLNELARFGPELAQTHRAKYLGREWLMQSRIPPLDCFWNDVLMFSPVHPARLLAVLRASGRTVRPQRWFEVDAALLAPSRTVLLRLHPDRIDSPLASDYLPFTPRALALCRSSAEPALARLRTLPPSAPVFLFADVPHVFFRGSLPLHHLRVIDV